MLTIGLTGGIGSGKTTVAKVFKQFGIPVYIADTEAKKLMTASKEIKQELLALFGNEAYRNGELNRSYVASLIFNNNTLLERMNTIVHPRVALHFKQWYAQQQAPYVIKEVAILFENGGYKSVDKVITVVAPEEIRIQRVIKRDASSTEKVKAIIKHQWHDADKVALSDYVITNIHWDDTLNQIHKIHLKILEII